MNDWRWGRKILPPEQEQTLGGIEGKREQSNATFGCLQHKLADRPELHQRLADLGGKMVQSTALIARLRYVMEFRHELKRMGLKLEQVQGLMPSRGTKWGQRPLFVIGFRDTESQEHLFQRPIRVPRE